MLRTLLLPIVTLSLLQRVAQGDSTALPECVDRYGSLVWSLARRLSSDADDAEDAAQEAFIELWRKAGRYEPERASEPTFIAMIVRRKLIDRSRTRLARQPTVVLDDTKDLPTELTSTASTEQVEVADEAAHASQALATLRPEQRRVLELSIYHGLSHEQIATSISMPLGTVKTHIRKGLARVRELLGASPLAEEAQS